MKVQPKQIILRPRIITRWQKRFDNASKGGIVPSMSSRALPIQASVGKLVHPHLYFQRVNNLISKVCKNDIASANLVRKAFILAWNGHSGQWRKSGEPYVDHPIKVAEIVAEWGMGAEEVAAALCHDVIEEGKINGQRVESNNLVRLYGSKVAQMVDGMTEFGKEPGFKGEAPSEVDIYKKLLEHGSKNLGSVIIKLADRLHNMRTLEHASPDSRKKKAAETLNVYRRIADILGMWEVKRELEDLSFQYVEPEVYQEIRGRLLAIAGKSRGRIERTCEGLKKEFTAQGLKADIKIERRGVYELYERMRNINKSRSDLSASDIWRVNIVVPEWLDTYRILGVVHKLYSYDQNEFKDHISNKCANGHQFLHTYVGLPGFSVDEPPLRLLLQVRDRAMNENYHLGVLSGVQKTETVWLDVLLKYLRAAEKMDVRDLYDRIAAVSAKMVTVTTGPGTHRQFPYGSTALDFAAGISYKVFCHAKEALINDQRAPLSQELQEGDNVFIPEDRHSWPTLAWREYVMTKQGLEYLKRALEWKLVVQKQEDGTEKIQIVRKTQDEIYRSASDYFEVQAKKYYLPSQELLASAFFKAFLQARGIRDDIDFLDKVGRGEVGVEDLLDEFMVVYKTAVQKQPKVGRIHRIMIDVAEDRSGLLEEITAPLAELGINKSAVFSYNYEKDGQTRARIYLEIEGVAGNAREIQQLQIRTIVGKPKGVSRVHVASPDEVEQFLLEYLKKK